MRKLLAKIRCWIRGEHNPYKFRALDGSGVCRECGKQLTNADFQ